jgi:hypothetical protein
MINKVKFDGVPDEIADLKYQAMKILLKLLLSILMQ